MRLRLPPTTIDWFKDGREHSITGDDFIQTESGLKVLLWNGYYYQTMIEAGFYEYDEILDSEILVDPRDRFKK